MLVERLLVGLSNDLMQKQAPVKAFLPKREFRMHSPKRWAARLHGGQLVIVLAFLLSVGLAAIWIGYQGFLLASNKDYALSYDLESGSPLRSIEKDTAFAAVMRTQASAEADVAFKMIVGGLIPLAASLLILWWWLNARRRSDL